MSIIIAGIHNRKRKRTPVPCTVNFRFLVGFGVVALVCGYTYKCTLGIVVKIIWHFMSPW